MENCIDFMPGVLLACIFVMLIIFAIYYPQKRLGTSFSRAFSVMINFVFLSVLADFLSYIIPQTSFDSSIALVSTLSWSYAVFTLLTLYLISNYCYLMTWAKKSRISRPILIIDAIPFVFSVVYLLILQARNDFILYDPPFAISRDSGYVILSGYCVYGVMDLMMMLFCRKSRNNSKIWITNFIGIVELLAMYIFARFYSVFIVSPLLALDTLLLFITVQYPKSCVDHSLNCFDSRALSIVLEDMETCRTDFYLLTIDIVNYRYFQAKYGMEFTEKMLRKLCSEMPKDTEKTSSYRYSSDVFVTLTTDFDQFQKMLDYSKGHLKASWFIDGIEVDVTFQISYYFRKYSEDEENMALFLDRIISYQKRDSQSRIICINETKELMNREVMVLNAIKKAIVSNTFTIYFQPIWNLKERKFDKAEVLIRLFDSVLGFVPPDEFIILAEKYNFIKEISHQIIQKALQAYTEYQLDRYGISNININLSSMELCNNEVSFYIKGVLKKYSLSPSVLTLEVTETAETESEETISGCINGFHEQGYLIALDDYGTGYSNMERILSMPFDFIKIDKNLLNLSRNSRVNEILLRKNIEMLRECGYSIVVEGVEKEDQVRQLESLNVDYIQGFFFARPMPIVDFVNLLKEQQAKEQKNQ